MGLYAEYLDKAMDFPTLVSARKSQLARISELREGNCVLTYAADFKKDPRVISIEYQDIMPIKDQLSNLKGSRIDVILETPGGSGEVAEDIVRMLRERFEYVAFVIPGTAKSAGTIMTMAGDDILMGPESSLGPIDAQITWQGKVFSADAFLEGLRQIKAEVEQTGRLNRAYVPLLSNISPGEIQNCQNALDFAKQLVTEWLAEYKFKNWHTHSSTSQPVTAEDRKLRAAQIAGALCAQNEWKTHGRSIKIRDLEKLRLRIVDYSKVPELADAIDRYYTLLRMTLETTNIYKVFETPTSQIYRFMIGGPPAPNKGAPSQGPLPAPDADYAVIDVVCPNCQNHMRLQANLTPSSPLIAGVVAFPSDNVVRCNRCDTRIDVREARMQIEAQARRPVVS